MNLSTELKQRAETGNPLRVALIGAGKFGSMYLAQARFTEGIQLVGVADLQIEHARNALLRVGWPSEQMQPAGTSQEINDLSSSGRVVLTESAEELIRAEVDVVVESTGSPGAATQHALWAIESGRHLVLVTVEADVLVGPLLSKRARQAGVVYSMAYGDQPALICELVDWARTCGFEVAAAGKGTKYLERYPYSTPDTVFQDYGFTAEQVRTGGFNAKMYNSFLDGTKSAIEMAAVANGTGLKPQRGGLCFPPVSIDRLADVLKPKSDGGILTHSGTVEVVASTNRDGSSLGQDLRWGVYVTFKAPSDYVRSCFGQYGLLQDQTGHYATLYRSHHLIGLELGISVAWAGLRQEPTGSAKTFLADVAACAKRDLKAGEILDGEGGYTVFGRLVAAPESLSAGLLPMGLASEATIVHAIAKDQLLTYADVRLPADSSVARLRRELENEFRPTTSLST